MEQARIYHFYHQLPIGRQQLRLYPLVVIRQMGNREQNSKYLKIDLVSPLDRGQAFGKLILDILYTWRRQKLKWAELLLCKQTFLE